MAYAFFAPFSLDMHNALVKKYKARHGVQYEISGVRHEVYVKHEVLGKSVEGRDIDLLIIGNPGWLVVGWWLVGGWAVVVSPSAYGHC